MEIDKAKRRWVDKAKNKDIWKAVKLVSKANACHPLESVLSLFDCVSSAAEGINEAFASYFISCQTPQRLPKVNDWGTLFEPHQVYKVLNNLPRSKASADLPFIVYKVAAHVIAEPLCHLFNISIDEGYVPLSWKTAKVIPLPKCASPGINDLRPISLLSTPLKILETLLLTVLSSKFISAYGNEQFGFRPGSSTSTALISLHDKITYYLDKENVAGVQILSYDFTKAFDKLCFDFIIQRLRSLNTFPSQALRWFQSYLYDRKQSVQIGTVLSNPRAITSGVPQGSSLGPYLFAAAVGEFTLDNYDVHLIKYADDFVICCPLLKNSTNHHVVEAHDRLLSWVSDTSLTVNLKKCKSLVISSSLNCNPVFLHNVLPVEKIKLLGVIFNDKLSWKDHIDSVVASTSKSLFLFRLFRKYFKKSDLFRLYFGIIRSRLEYCAPLFLGLSDGDSLRLDRLQSRFQKGYLR
ncbi:MAG: reverse transcriptase family protein [Pseudomonadota bacterium]